MEQQPRRSAVPVIVVMLLATAGLLWWGRRDRPAPRVATSEVERPTTTLKTAGTPEDAAPSAEATAGDGTAAAPGVPEPSDTPWAAVDMAKVREAMPDNVYWKMSFPTKDEALIRERQEQRDRWNVEYGKVLSGTATAEEIDAYYAQQQKLFQDYVEFGTYLLVQFGDKLSIRDVGLLKVAVELNMARLEEIPRKQAEAQERRVEHDAARRAWLEEQKEFETNKTD